MTWAHWAIAAVIVAAVMLCVKRSTCITIVAIILCTGILYAYNQTQAVH